MSPSPNARRRPSDRGQFARWPRRSEGGAPAGGGVATYADAQAQDALRYRAFFHAMADAGVLLPPSAFEAWFVSAAHDDDAVGRVLDAVPAAARAAATAAN